MIDAVCPHTQHLIQKEWHPSCHSGHVFPSRTLRIALPSGAFGTPRPCQHHLPATNHGGILVDKFSNFKLQTSWKLHHYRSLTRSPICAFQLVHTSLQTGYIVCHRVALRLRSAQGQAIADSMEACKPWKHGRAQNEKRLTRKTKTGFCSFFARLHAGRLWKTYENDSQRPNA